MQGISIAIGFFKEGMSLVVIMEKKLMKNFMVTSTEEVLRQNHLSLVFIKKF